MMEFIKKYHSVLAWTLVILAAMWIVRSCDENKHIKAEQQLKDESYAKEKKVYENRITLDSNMIVGHRFKEQHMAIENQVLRAKADKLPTARSFKKTDQELDSTPKNILEKNYVTLQEVDSVREAITNKALDNNDSLITEVEREHMVADSKDSTENKLDLLCDSALAAERKRGDNWQKRAKTNGFLAKIGWVVAAVLGLLNLAK